MENCRLAFDVASKLGIPRVLDPSEVTSTKRPPDLLSMMTYLHQIRTHCTADYSTGVSADQSLSKKVEPAKQANGQDTHQNNSPA